MSEQNKGVCQLCDFFFFIFPDKLFCNELLIKLRMKCEMKTLFTRVFFIFLDIHTFINPISYYETRRLNLSFCGFFFSFFFFVIPIQHFFPACTFEGDANEFNGKIGNSAFVQIITKVNSKLNNCLMFPIMEKPLQCA